jgi:hypothetical protein
MRILLLLLSIMAAPHCHSSLLHHYTFTSDAFDSIGTENGTLFGNARIVNGELNLDGDGDFVQFETHLIPTTGNYTVAFFASEYSRPEPFGTLVSQGWSESVYGGLEGFYIGRMYNGNLRAVGFIDTSTPFPTGRHHYALTTSIEEGHSILYIDGEVLSVLDYAIQSQPLGTDTRFGRQFESSAYTEFFHGILDDVRIYDNALSGQEIATLVTPLPTPIGLFLCGACTLLLLTRPSNKPAQYPTLQ